MLRSYVFKQDDLTVLKVMGRFILTWTNKEYSIVEDLVKDLTELSQMDLQELTTEAQQRLYSRKTLTSLTSVRHVTKVSTICKVINSITEWKDCLPQLHKLLNFLHESATGISDCGLRSAGLV